MHERFTGQPRKRVVISGASGLIGQHLSTFLKSGGHEIFHLVRRTPSSDKDIFWDIGKKTVDLSRLENMDAIIHLAGESIAGRWTESKKRKIVESRVNGTRLLAESIPKLKNPPNVFISASAVGAYGNDEKRWADEETGFSQCFLGQVCRRWEEASHPVTASGVRVVNPRIGMVLSGKGGALKKMLPAFRAGIGGRLAHGRQWMSWIALDDVVGLLYECLMRDDIKGPINLVAPNPVQNGEFTKTIGKNSIAQHFFQSPT